ncbi:enoyl-CoA delta isomerase 2, mitochondrial [Drosophila hydei]|uniref:Enoyl-CoA delta isomerase 2, mitochondrial n=1 Tax=Drosophila hydei TaxID=7224 RepID=A0A6J1LVG8_DROHY|nr:enoyl-CoA delta isomerase 2, mitochondrial [Drosophila hydei]
MSEGRSAAPATNFNTFKELRVARRGSLLEIQFNRPAVQNALRRRTIYELLRALDVANADEMVSIVVLTGNSTAFTSGNDLTDLLALQRKNGAEALDVHFRASNFVMKALVKKILNNRKVLVALVQGNCVGLGVVICALCDVIYATESAQFWLPFSQLGLCAEGGTSWTLPQLLGRSKAAELLLFGERLNGQAALQHGMISSLVSNEQEFWKRMEQHSRLPNVSLCSTKKLLLHPWRQQLLDALETECMQLEALRLGPTYRAQIMAFARRSKL